MKTPVPDHALRRLLADAEPLLEETTRLPERIGKYRVVRLIGRGGMGVVYEARDDELGRSVALKLLDPASAANPALRERLLREARAAARLNHPNVAAVYDAGDGWIAMRLIAGSPLHERLDADLRTRVAWIRDAALALQHAHDAGLVHRDVKPHNLLIEGDRLFVTDFGLAKELAVDSSLSLSGHVLGSPAYMAPEQAQGRVHDVDARTDVFGLGATLHHALCGRPPFDEADVVRLLKRIVEEEPPPPRSLAPEIPRDLETVVLRCLEKEPARRYATARALADELDRWLRGEPVLARRPSLAYRAGKFTRRHRLLVALSAATAIALAAAGAAAWNERVGQRASEQALKLAEQVAAVVADHVTHKRLAEEEEADARLDEGVAACEAFLAGHDVARGHFLLGRLERIRARTRPAHAARARAALDRALELDPELAEARLERGLLLAAELAAAREGTMGPVPPSLVALRDRALADLESAVRDPARLSALSVAHARAEILRLNDDLAGARRAFKAVQRLDPVNEDVETAQRQLALQAGDGAAAWEHAMSLVDLARGLGPAYVARRERGDAGREQGPQALPAELLRIDDVEGALADFTHALQADPSDAFAAGNLALVRARQAARLAAEGKSEEALASWDTAILDLGNVLTLEPTLAGAWNNRAVCRSEKERLLVGLGREDAAAEERRVAGADLDEALRLNPRFVLARQNRASQRRRIAEAAARRGDWSVAEEAVLEAGQDASEALRLRADDDSLWLERARVSELESELFDVRGDRAASEHARDLARADFDVAVGLAADDGRALALRGLHRLRARDAGGRSDLEAALAMPLDRGLKERLQSELARNSEESQ